MAALLLAMIVLVFTNVLLRYGFSSGLRPSVELSRLGLVWLVMLGAAVVLRRNEHLAVADFSERLLPRAVPVLRRLAYAVIAVAVLMLFWGAFKQMNANWNNISQLTGLPSAPVIPPSLPLILIGVAGNISIKDLFLSGIAPGLNDGHRAGGRVVVADERHRPGDRRGR